MDGQSVKTTERGGVRGFDAHKRVKGRKRHILVDTLGLPVANRVEPAGMSDRRAGARLLASVGVTIFQTGFDHWVDDPDAASLAMRIREAAEQLAGAVAPNAAASYAPNSGSRNTRRGRRLSQDVSP